MRFRSTLLAGASGKINGAVASHNRYGQYLRVRVQPVNPRRPLQTAIRAVFATISGWWTKLTKPQQTGWADYASNTPVRDRKMGGTTNLTANAMYCRSNVARVQAALPRVDAPPTVNQLPTFTTPTLVLGTGSSTLHLRDLATSDGWQGSTKAALLVSAGAIQNPGRNFVQGPFQFLGTIGGAVAVTSGTVELPFITPATSGSRVFVSIRSTTPDGRLSDSQRLAVTVGAV